VENIQVGCMEHYLCGRLHNRDIPKEPEGQLVFKDTKWHSGS